MKLLRWIHARRDARAQSKAEQRALEEAFSVRAYEVFGDVTPGTLLVFSQESPTGECLSPEIKERLFGEYLYHPPST